jgi:hypothetical protein
MDVLIFLMYAQKKKRFFSCFSSLSLPFVPLNCTNIWQCVGVCVYIYSLGNVDERGTSILPSTPSAETRGEERDTRESGLEKEPKLINLGGPRLRPPLAKRI